MAVRSAFTLVELVAVITVLGILSGVAISKYVDYARTARIQRVLADANAIKSAMQLYFYEYQSPPPPWSDAFAPPQYIRDRFEQDPFSKYSPWYSASPRQPFVLGLASDPTGPFILITMKVDVGVGNAAESTAIFSAIDAKVDDAVATTGRFTYSTLVPTGGTMIGYGTANWYIWY